MKIYVFLNRLLIAMAAGVIATGLGYFSQPAAMADEKAKLSRSDKAFIKEAYEGGLAEIKSGEMAQTKATKTENQGIGGEACNGPSEDQ